MDMTTSRAAAAAYFSNTVDIITERLFALGYIKEKAITLAQRRRIMQSQARMERAYLPKLSNAARSGFENDKRNTLAIMSGANRKSLNRKATVNWEEVNYDLYQYFANAGDDEWRALFAPLFRSIVIESSERWSSAFGIAFDVQNLDARDYFNQYTIKFAQEINDTTERDIAQIMARAQADGASVAQVQNQLDALFSRYMSGELPPDEFEWYTDRTPAYRKELIARTEFTKSSNSGSFETFSDWGAPKKEWLTAMDGRERADHGAANGQIVGINEAFIVGGSYMMFPGDPTADISQLANCRCTFAPVLS